MNPHVHSILPDGLFVPGPAGDLVFARLPPPTTAEVEALTRTVTRRLTDRLAAASEAEGDGYLDPELAALCEPVFWSRNPPPGTRDLPLPAGPETAGSEEEGLRGKPLCASLAGFSLHAAQSVPAFDRDGLERLCRYGLRAPFAQERLSRLPDGRVLYQLRRPWPTPKGATHLVLEPLDFLRRLAALVSFPYAHGVRYHGVFSGRSRCRTLLPPPLPRDPPGPEPAAGSVVPDGRSGGASGGQEDSPRGSPRRIPWARLIRPVFSADSLACPRCSSREQPVPLVVLAFLTDPEVVRKILACLGLPTSAPARAKAGSSDPPLGFDLPDEHIESDRTEGSIQQGVEVGSIRPPP